MAFMLSLTHLRENVAAALVEYRRTTRAPVDCRCDTCGVVNRLLEQLDADVREVRADVEAIMANNGEGW